MTIVRFGNTNVCKINTQSSCKDLYTDITDYIEEKALQLKHAENVNAFISECKELNSRLDVYKNDCNKCYEGSFLTSLDIEGKVLKTLKTVTRYGGCPRNFTGEDEERIKLMNDIDEFCQKRNDYIKDLQSLGKTCQAEPLNKKSCDTKNLSYKSWLAERKHHFNPKFSAIEEFSSGPSPKLTLPNDCDVTNLSIFEDNNQYCSACNPKESSVKDIPEASCSNSDGKHTPHAGASEETEKNNLNLKYERANSKLNYIIFDVDEISPNELYNSLSDASKASCRSPKTCEYAFFKGTYPFESSNITNAETAEAVSKDILLTKEEPSSEDQKFQEEPSPSTALPVVNSDVTPPSGHESHTYELEKVTDTAEIVSTRSNETLEEIPYKNYIIIIIAILAIIALLSLLCKYTLLGLMLNKKKKKKHKQIKAELQRVLLDQSDFQKKNIYFAYSRLEH
ncbi:PIR protein [Plasmodium vivax]|uniref:VIR protein n=1 Tax=Plasmodium vivax TaxID=5855 RepID=A0A565A5E8_PLAVI|nr:PIR protein [Plasmodium vivax]